MSYCFVRITDNYPQFIENFYLQNPSATQLSYNEQYSSLVNSSYETASLYVKNLNKMGINAHGIITNATELQNTWKKENNLPSEISKQKLVIEQLKKYKPDVIWIDDFSIIDSEWKNELLKQVPSIKLFIASICAPYNSIIADKFKLFDVIFSCIPCQQKELLQNGANAHLLYHAFEASALENINVNNRFTDIGFLFSGSLYAGSGFHKTRIEYIEAFLKEGIKMDLYCNLESQLKLIAKKGIYTTLTILKQMQLESVIETVPFLKKYKSYGNTPIHFYSRKLLQSSKPPVFGYEMYQLLSKANICFNIHGEVAEKCAGNIRLFEATGLGTCLVTDWKENIHELFEPDKEIVTYKSIPECIEKVKWLTNNPNERKAIALAGQKRTLSNHTFANRCEALHKIIVSALNK